MEASQKKIARNLAVAGAVFSPIAANAADWSSVTGGIDFSGEVTAILAIVGLLAGVIVAFKGGKFVLSALKGG